MCVTVRVCSKLCFHYSSHVTPPGVFQWNLTFILYLLKTGSRAEMDSLSLILRPSYPLEQCWLPLAAVLRSFIVEDPAPSNDVLRFRASPNL